MEIDNVLKEFVERCSKELDLFGIIQFGSSTYSKNPDDIDLMLISNEKVISARKILFLIKIIKGFEKKCGEVVFDFGGGKIDRKRKGKYAITVIFLGREGLNVKYHPHDLFFFKGLSEDKNKKILFGKNPFINLNFKLNNKQLYEKLSVEIIHALRRTLDDENYKFDSLYTLFKTFIRDMLINEKESLKKEELITNFKKKFGNKIKLPKNADGILLHKLKKSDFEDILYFTENCLKYLSK